MKRLSDKIMGKTFKKGMGLLPGAYKAGLRAPVKKANELGKASERFM